MIKSIRPSLSLRFRIFLSMIFIIVVAAAILASISIFQFKKEAKIYHQIQLEEKQIAVQEHINYILANTSYPLKTEYLPLIFNEKIHELSQIHDNEINIYALDGKLLKSSKEAFSVDKPPRPIPKYIIRLVGSAVSKKFVEIKPFNGYKIRSLYSQIKDNKFKPLGILNLPYIENNDHYEKELQSFLVRLGQVYTTMLLLSFALAYFLSSYITQSLKTIAEKISITTITQKNEKIELQANSTEIRLLINAYNDMVDKLERSAKKLAQSEREGAWREMAKQVAHEIKNPLTPMRLTVQSFQRRFDPLTSDAPQKLKQFADSLILQIDTMSAVASAFSNFASMPTHNNEIINIVAVAQNAIAIFEENYISFSATNPNILLSIDKTQLTQIITNLVKNAIQAIPENQAFKKVDIQVFALANEIKITVSDNGKGIEEQFKDRIFEPKFTTKSSGMGLGLAIIKNIIENYNGNITFESKLDKGTSFVILFPKNNL